MEFPGYTGKTVHMKRELREIYNYILYMLYPEISIDMNRESARFARSIIKMLRTAENPYQYTEIQDDSLIRSFAIQPNSHTHARYDNMHALIPEVLLYA